MVALDALLALFVALSASATQGTQSPAAFLHSDAKEKLQQKQ
jgi:hypothetical protein